MSADRERRLAEAFFAPEERPRSAASAPTAKGRSKFISTLAHPKALDAGFARRLPPGERNVGAIYEELQRRGAPIFCYVVSENACIDRRQVTLRDALERVVGAEMGTLVCRVPGRLAYSEAEEPGERCVHERGGQ